MAAVFHQQSAGEELVRVSPTQYGSGTCKWFNTRLGFSFLTMTTMGSMNLDSPIEVFVHQDKIHMKGFRSLKDGEAVQFAFMESPEGLECIWVTGPGGAYCIGKKKPQRKDKCYNCGEWSHHAKERKLPPQPK
ncbi:protein lin-28 homolog A-like [Caloenas nicobarica]|uniref:protein lin-28 homolog A-like n=1 Tax=Caloenas nicobarica TaxID=187106 RepID=UPI0032B82021